jgi:molybdate transport system ATP-binding protein
MTDRLGMTLHAVSVRRGDKWVLRDLNLAFEPGERWALIGDNGAGKTQLLKLLAGDVWPTPTGRERRTYRIGRRPVDLIEAKTRMVYLGAELQDKYSRYGWDLVLHDLIATGLHHSDLLLAPISVLQHRKIHAMLRACGLERLAQRRFSTLSYGQKRLALLARGLVQAPDWLLLDEFYNGLDTQFRERIDRVLEAARGAGRSWIVAAHRAGDVPRGTRGLIEMSAGRVVSVHARGLDALARLSAPPKSRPAPRRALRRAAARVRRAAAQPPLIRIDAAALYVDYRPVIQGLNWELRAGEHWAISGANGAGKTSFLKLLYGDLTPALGGRIERAGYPAGTPIAAWKRQVGYVSPELQTDYAIEVSVADLVASGRHASIGLNETPSAQDRLHARRWLKFFRLSSLARRRPRELSYGQLRRALFARAMAAQPRILLLDEPLTGLDPRQRAAVRGLLERLMRRRVTLVIAVHHAEDLPRGMTHGLRLCRRRALPADPYSAN